MARRSSGKRDAEVARNPARALTELSKSMSYVLRHGAQKLGLELRADGYARLADFLALPQFAQKNITEAMINEVVAADNKSRYSLTEEEGIKWIRANQGHSMTGVIDEEELLTRINDPTEVPVCVHGTYHKFLPLILESGLKRMKRTHIHFATALPETGEAKSGMRMDCQVALYVDVAAAMSDGHTFFRSQNGVILCPGQGPEGLLPAKYLRVHHLKQPPGEQNPHKRANPLVGVSPCTSLAERGGALPEQNFDYFVVLDFEATCLENQRIKPQEIIEWPSVLVDAATLQVVDEFRVYVKPIHHPQLSEFCSNLTGIQQMDVDSGVTFERAMEMYNAWLRKHRLLEHPRRFAFITCGDWDLGTQLSSQCRAFKVPLPSHFRTWINMKFAYANCYGQAPTDMASVLQFLGLPLIGKHHCGLDDCRNIAAVVIHMIRERGYVCNLTHGTQAPITAEEAAGLRALKAQLAAEVAALPDAGVSSVVPQPSLAAAGPPPPTATSL